MIKIKQYNNKWRIHIDEEILEFEDDKKFKEILDKLLDLKKDFGNTKTYN